MKKDNSGNLRQLPQKLKDGFDADHALKTYNSLVLIPIYSCGIRAS
jgi:hypothetical protein